MKNVCILIPAYCPDERLLTLISALVTTEIKHIVVVNDGSDQNSQSVFEKISGLEKVIVLTHATNLGKGAALKTGLNYIYTHFLEITGIVTADADGQHTMQDILVVVHKMQTASQSLVLGARQWEGAIPWRSRFGNQLTRTLFRWIVGTALTDTQSGLRGIPRKIIPTLLRIPTQGYDFELDMLITCKQIGCPVIEQTIQTIYLDNNASSHFNPVVDSLKIYFVLFRYMLLSLATATVDYLTFILMQLSGAHLLASQALARTMSIVFNYPLAKRKVFFSSVENKGAFPKFVLLVITSGTISYGLIQFLMLHFSMKVIPAKMLSEMIVYLGNFAIQRDFIFTSRLGRVLNNDWSG